MIEISESDYRQLSLRLKERIGDGYFFNGTIEYDTGDFYSTLTATAIVYRSDKVCPDGRFSQIDDVVPVWWTFETVCGPESVLNDFGFDELRRYI